MAKVLKYKFLAGKVNHGTEENPDIEQIFLNKSISWSETNEEIAKQEAYNGEYVIGEVDEPEAEPTEAERIAELEEALAMLLSGVTE